MEAVEKNVTFVGRARDQARALNWHGARLQPRAQTPLLHDHNNHCCSVELAPWLPASACDSKAPSHQPTHHHHPHALMPTSTPSPPPPTVHQVDFSPKDLAQVANFLAKENVAKQVGLIISKTGLKAFRALCCDGAHL